MPAGGGGEVRDAGEEGGGTACIKVVTVGG